MTASGQIFSKLLTLGDEKHEKLSLTKFTCCVCLSTTGNILTCYSSWRNFKRRIRGKLNFLASAQPYQFHPEINRNNENLISQKASWARLTRRGLRTRGRCEVNDYAENRFFSHKHGADCIALFPPGSHRAESALSSIDFASVKRMFECANGSMELPTMIVCLGFPHTIKQPLCPAINCLTIKINSRGTPWTKPEFLNFLLTQNINSNLFMFPTSHLKKTFFRCFLSCLVFCCAHDSTEPENRKVCDVSINIGRWEDTCYVSVIGMFSLGASVIRRSDRLSMLQPQHFISFSLYIIEKPFLVYVGCLRSHKSLNPHSVYHLTRISPTMLLRSRRKIKQNAQTNLMKNYHVAFDLCLRELKLRTRLEEEAEKAKVSIGMKRSRAWKDGSHPNNFN